MEQTLTSRPSSTIAAIATAPGTSAIAVIRISGPEAIQILQRVWQGMPVEKMLDRTLHLGYIIGPDHEQIDQVLISIMRAPGTYTGEDTVEISCHGSRWIQRAILDTLMTAGAQMAGPGEFTKRAFINGRLDLATAEGVADMIAASSRASQRLAMTQMKGDYSRRLNKLRDDLIQLAALLELELDFSEEDVEFASREKIQELATNLRNEITRLLQSYKYGSVLKEGIPTAIIGATNAGKSSLLNCLIGDDRAIVSDIHGTTRDSIEETLEIEDYLFRFIDTAGLRQTTDTIERIGIQRAYDIASNARIILHITDATSITKEITPALPEEINNLVEDTTEESSKPTIIHILNKSDLLPLNVQDNNTSPLPHNTIYISAKTGYGIPRLKELLVESMKGQIDDRQEITVTNARHSQALQQALTSIERTITGINQDQTIDLITQDMRETIHHLGTITGAVTTPDILQSIFTHFCIGK